MEGPCYLPQPQGPQGYRLLGPSFHMCALGLRPSPEPPPTTRTPHAHQYFILFIVPTGQGFVSSAADMGESRAPKLPGRGGGSLNSCHPLVNLTLHGWAVQGRGVKMQARHVSCLMGHLSQEPTVGGGGVLAGYWLKWGEATDIGQMQE